MSENEDKIKQLEEELRIAKLEKELAEAKAGNKELQEKEQKEKEQDEMKKRWAEHRKQRAKEAEEQKNTLLGIGWVALVIGAFALFLFLATGGGISIDKQKDGSYCTTVNPIPDEDPVTYCGNTEAQVQNFKDCITSAKTDFTMHTIAAASGMSARTEDYVGYCKASGMWEKGEQRGDILEDYDDSIPEVGQTSIY